MSSTILLSELNSLYPGIQVLRNIEGKVLKVLDESGYVIAERDETDRLVSYDNVKPRHQSPNYKKNSPNDDINFTYTNHKTQISSLEGVPIVDSRGIPTGETLFLPYSQKYTTSNKCSPIHIKPDHDEYSPYTFEQTLLLNELQKYSTNDLENLYNEQKSRRSKVVVPTLINNDTSIYSSPYILNEDERRKYYINHLMRRQIPQSPPERYTKKSAPTHSIELSSDRSQKYQPREHISREIYGYHTTRNSTEYNKQSNSRHKIYCTFRRRHSKDKRTISKNNRERQNNSKIISRNARKDSRNARKDSRNARTVSKNSRIDRRNTRSLSKNSQIDRRNTRSLSKNSRLDRKSSRLDRINPRTSNRNIRNKKRMTRHNSKKNSLQVNQYKKSSNIDLITNKSTPKYEIPYKLKPMNQIKTEPSPREKSLNTKSNWSHVETCLQETDETMKILQKQPLTPRAKKTENDPYEESSREFVPSFRTETSDELRKSSIIDLALRIEPTKKYIASEEHLNKSPKLINIDEDINKVQTPRPIDCYLPTTTGCSIAKLRQSATGSLGIIIGKRNCSAVVMDVEPDDSNTPVAKWNRESKNKIVPDLKIVSVNKITEFNLLTQELQNSLHLKIVFATSMRRKKFEARLVKPQSKRPVGLYLRYVDIEPNTEVALRVTDVIDGSLSALYNNSTKGPKLEKGMYIIRVNDQQCNARKMLQQLMKGAPVDIYYKASLLPED